MNYLKSEIPIFNPAIKKEIISPKSENIILNLSAYYKNIANDSETFSGQIKHTPKGSFNGDVFNEKAKNPFQSVFGYFYKEENLTKLILLKTSEENYLSNMLYVVEKESNQDLFGSYWGKWYSLPYKVPFSQEFDVFLYKMYEVQVDMVLMGIGDNSQIKISKEIKM